jgi:hypothetical protein
LDGEKLSTPYRIKLFSGAVVGEEEEDFCKGSFRTHILYFVLSFALLYFYLHHFIKNPKKLESFIVAFIYLLISLVRMSNPEVEVRTFKQQEGESFWWKRAKIYVCSQDVCA